MENAYSLKDILLIRKMQEKLDNVLESETKESLEK